MSIVINALKKAGKNRKEAKRKYVGHLFHLPTHSGKGGRGFLFGIFVGFLVMILLVAGFLSYILLQKENRVSSDHRDRLVKKDILISDIDLEELDDEDIGLDIDDELYLENILKIDKKVSEEVKQESVEPKIEKKAITLNEIGFPELVVSGVIWDFYRRYVFINGVPYRENDFCGEVKILGINISHLNLMFKDKEYEIVLK